MQWRVIKRYGESFVACIKVFWEDLIFHYGLGREWRAFRLKILPKWQKWDGKELINVTGVMKANFIHAPVNSVFGKTIIESLV